MKSWIANNSFMIMEEKQLPIPPTPEAPPVQLKKDKDKNDWKAAAEAKRLKKD